MSESLLQAFPTMARNQGSPQHGFDAPQSWGERRTHPDGSKGGVKNHSVRGRPPQAEFRFRPSDGYHGRFYPTGNENTRVLGDAGGKKGGQGLWRLGRGRSPQAGGLSRTLLQEPGLMARDC